MVEVLFGDSEVASMRESGIVNRDKVICLAYNLDIGSIREPVDSIYRKNLVTSMLVQNQWEQDDEFKAEIEKAYDIYVNELQRLKDFIVQGETIRVWYCDVPYSLCGLYHLCDELYDLIEDLFLIKLPDYKVNGDIIIDFQNWGEIAPEEFALFEKYEYKISKQEIRMYKLLWLELKDENSPLRTFINGRLISVNDDFYDFLLWKNISDKPVKQAMVIGRTLGKYHVGISDYWYAKRIDYYIKQKKILIVEDSEKKYARTICLNTKQ